MDQVSANGVEGRQAGKVSGGQLPWSLGPMRHGFLEVSDGDKEKNWEIHVRWGCFTLSLYLVCVQNCRDLILQKSETILSFFWIRRNLSCQEML